MIIYALDMQRILSVLPILTSRQVEICDLKIDQKGSVVKKGGRDLKTLVCLLKCVLDVAVSVAASVIVFLLLLLSGDIEQNPGPLGGNVMKEYATL